MLTSEASCDNIGIHAAVINLFCKTKSCAINPWKNINEIFINIIANSFSTFRPTTKIKSVKIKLTCISFMMLIWLSTRNLNRTDSPSVLRLWIIAAAAIQIIKWAYSSGANSSTNIMLEKKPVTWIKIEWKE